MKTSPAVIWEELRHYFNKPGIRGIKALARKSPAAFPTLRQLSNASIQELRALFFLSLNLPMVKRFCCASTWIKKPLNPLNHPFKMLHSGSHYIGVWLGDMTAMCAQFRKSICHSHCETSCCTHCTNAIGVLMPVHIRTGRNPVHQMYNPNSNEVGMLCKT